MKPLGEWLGVARQFSAATITPPIPSDGIQRLGTRLYSTADQILHRVLRRLTPSEREKLVIQNKVVPKEVRWVDDSV